jgi:ArsR family transcriptional regulator, arsenate/arsenite/antimonite-responsive transcriptional repressor
MLLHHIFKQLPNCYATSELVKQLVDRLNDRMQKVFEALSSTARRKILAYLSEAEMSAGDIAERFAMSKPAISQHLAILENAGLVEREKRGQYVYYRLVPESLTNTLNGFVQQVCPVSRPLKAESARIRKARED